MDWVKGTGQLMIQCYYLSTSSLHRLVPPLLMSSSRRWWTNKRKGQRSGTADSSELFPGCCKHEHAVASGVCLIELTETGGLCRHKHSWNMEWSFKCYCGRSSDLAHVGIWSCDMNVCFAAYLFILKNHINKHFPFLPPSPTFLTSLLHHPITLWPPFTSPLGSRHPFLLYHPLLSPFLLR